MKLFVTFISSLVLANALTYIPSPHRLRRDVSELSYQYLPPAADLQLSTDYAIEILAQPEETQESAVLTQDGYKYKTVRKLRYKKKRDVSHLNLAYLPPTPPTREYLPPAQINDLLPSSPSNEYLPPVADVKQMEIVTEPPQPSKEYLPPVEIKEPEVVTEAPQPSIEYLPPVAEIKEAEVVTETPEPSKEYLPPVTEIVTEPPQPSKEYLPPVVKETEVITEPPQIPTNEYLPPTNAGEDISLLPLETSSEQVEIETKAPEVSAPKETSAEVVEAPQDSAVLETDGYHYKVPEKTPELFPTINPTTEYFPPLEEGVVEADGPTNGESAVLEQDGYHYRSIKRRF
ncbi:hypothetical protein CVS40_3807 [Lucilia cuprina]|nr:hypothetical protein CVS40_3807 [Lucilia cuprina]